VHVGYLLALLLSVALALATHPSTSPGAASNLIDLPLDDLEYIGAHCPLVAWDPAEAEIQPGIWTLPPYRQVTPFRLIEAGYPDAPFRPHDLVVQVTCTAYSSTRDQTDSTPFLTASLQPVGPHIIALSRDLLRRYTPGAPFDFGDVVEVVGVGLFRVEDTMHRRWQRRADIWVASRSEARQWGRRDVLVGKLRDDDTRIGTLRPSRRDASDDTAPALLEVELLPSETPAAPAEPAQS
jgi:3D (Asp-Asp-Asp) domain-containing protein